MSLLPVALIIASSKCSQVSLALDASSFGSSQNDASATHLILVKAFSPQTLDSLRTRANILFRLFSSPIEPRQVVHGVGSQDSCPRGLLTLEQVLPFSTRPAPTSLHMSRLLLL
jgi:hypothetical protein